MKNMILILLVLVFAMPAKAQEMSARERRKMEKQLRKEQEAERAARNAEIVKLMVEQQRFVLEADRLRDKRGNQVNVPSTLNFIAIDSSEAVIQIGSNSYVGANGVGGITVEGRVSGYEYDYSERSASYSISFRVRSTTGSYDVIMSIYGSDARGDARVSSSWPGKVNYLGYVVPIPQSRVFKGMSRY